ncbi:hypothetical protein X760_33255 [Mesorhizobium sp. LSHC422A00]|uniref:DUF1515 family protein n=1 Tax=unclassified Mesorhizobium TaxID=325217 RepID=UPI0003CF72D3|nr:MULTISPECIES: DUF1515 family protein [unclassified Mesorhizobium]ESX41151.1 hypothetical protein X762_30430 [Mesorhizobium sp. LSHC426A00]ESX46730.1 hypothetical protein X760_33255 [Mesorhizobium sp. LSHC422A00]ESX46954.1 hypothetical protein X761_30760 [Mesorhizobium sp. LSHC424B00]ESX64015.1 hypothetical protein X758_32260 [Mesorhizobium sp. LSHC416B00]
MTEVEAVSAEVTRWKLMGLGALGVTGMAAAALASLSYALLVYLARAARRMTSRRHSRQALKMTGDV